MSSIVDEINTAGLVDGDALKHYGMPRRSGRYPWGSGDDPYQHGEDFIARVESMRSKNQTYVDEKTGKTYSGDTAIAKKLGLTSSQFRTEIALAKDERRMHDVARAESLKADGLGASEIARRMSTPDRPINESTVRGWFDAKAKNRMNQAKETASFIKEQVDKKGMVDIGTGVEKELRISKEKLEQAIYMVEREGYPVYKGGIPDPTNPGQQTNQRIICVPGTQHKEIYQHDKVHALNEDQYISRDNGESYEKKFHYPESMDSKRLMIRYKDDKDSMGVTGIEKDGVCEIRPGVKDLSLGDSRYSQVRILVDGTHYVKGMAVYGDPKDFPPGVDVIFNTNKGKEKSKMEVLKEIKKDPDNPFGSAIKDADKGGQYWYDDGNGGKKLGLINKRADEGDWTEWKDALPSQFLAKQSRFMMQKQLDLAKADKAAEFDDIMQLENPTLKKHYLDKFAESCDSAAVHLKAAALPGQKYHVIIPNGTLKENEIYAPGYENGTQLALVRYPHGGTFEIPVCTVNNKNPLGKRLIGTDPIDAVCINSKVAERLSGADFDGDTVMCIPTNDKKGKVKVTSTKPLEDLVGFDPKAQYGTEVKVDAKGNKKYYRDGREIRIMKNTGTQMGVISNLITDMTLAGAPPEELARAVKHSMVVIDAEKHKLDYRQSEIDNRIAELHKEYQGKATGGAATLLSRSKGQKSVDKRQGQPKVNLKDKEWYDPSKPEGSLIYKTADDLYYPIRSTDKKTGIQTIKLQGGGKVEYDVTNSKERSRYAPVKRTDPETGKVTYTDSTGTLEYKLKKRTQKSTKMAETEDAYTLVSEYKHPAELIYADHANYMKDLARQARVASANTGKIAYDRNAKKVYAEEVKSLNDKLLDAEMNAPRERQAKRMTNAAVAAKKAADPEMKTSDIKKANQRSLSKYREEYGSVARRDRAIEISDREWSAIQAGAVSENTLKRILNNSNPDSLRARAMPKEQKGLRPAQENRIKALSKSNYTLDQIAQKMGVSKSTVANILKGEK